MSLGLAGSGAGAVANVGAGNVINATISAAVAAVAFDTAFGSLSLGLVGSDASDVADGGANDVVAKH